MQMEKRCAASDPAENNVKYCRCSKSDLVFVYFHRLLVLFFGFGLKSACGRFVLFSEESFFFPSLHQTPV